MNKCRPSKDDLVKMYVSQGLSKKEMRESLGVRSSTISQWMREYGIEDRPRWGDGTTAKPSKEELEALYVVQDLRIAEVSDQLGVGANLLLRWMREYDIPIRPRFLNPKFQVCPSKSLLEHLYLAQMLSMLEIAHVLGAGRNSIPRWMKRHGIETRADRWRGGIYISRDGHATKSSMELRVDDWLFSHDIPHEYETTFPGGGKFKCDFRADGQYIEVWGMDTPAYNARKQRKQAIYECQKLPLVEIPYWAFRTAMWERILTEAFNCPKTDHP